MNRSNSFWKVRMQRNTKNEFIGSWSNTNNQRKNIDLTKFNGAIITGPKTNLVVLDVDVKKDQQSDKTDGMTEWATHIEQHGEVNTFKVLTPSGGFHYYFKYDNANERVKYLMENYLPNKSGYRNSGLDITTKGGVIMMLGSLFDCTTYEI